MSIPKYSPYWLQRIYFSSTLCKQLNKESVFKLTSKLQHTYTKLPDQVIIYALMSLLHLADLKRCFSVLHILSGFQELRNGRNLQVLVKFDIYINTRTQTYTQNMTYFEIRHWYYISPFHSGWTTPSLGGVKKSYI